MKQILMIVVLLIFSTGLCGAEEHAPVGKTAENGEGSRLAPPVETLVAEAFALNPDLQASEAQWQMFIEKARQAGSLDDPMLMLGINNALIRDPLAFDRDVMTSKSIGISQMVPFFGKRDLARESANLEAKSYEARYQERRLEMAEMIKETYAKLYFVERALEIVGRNLRVMDDIIGFAETRYGVGTGMQQDILRAQVERSRMLDMQIGLQQQRRSLEVAMNRLLHRPVGAPIGSIPDPETPPVPLSADELASLAEKNRPVLQGLSALVEKGKTDEKLAKKEYYPDFTFALEYMQREPAMEEEGYDMYNASVTFNLPVRRERRRAMTAEAAAQTRMARAELGHQLHEIHSGIAESLTQMEKAGKLIDLYKSGIIPQAARSFESAQIAYQNNQADFMTMLESLQFLFNTEREYFDAVAEYRMNLAKLETLVGGELPADR